MPNMASGLVSVTGTKQNVTNFVSRFIFDGRMEETVGPKLRYFARSFTNTVRQVALDKLAGTFSGKPESTECAFDLSVDFTWSASSCLINGDPQNCPDKCITLMDACIADQVSVIIRTKEQAMLFEEHITCDEFGQITFECMDLLTHKCPKCEYATGMAYFFDSYVCICPECGEANLIPIESEDSVNG